MTQATDARVDGAQRWDSLDALRGVAALLVVFFHCAQVTAGFATRIDPTLLGSWAEPWTWFKYTPLRILVSSGPSAVVLFFALSGFVLSLPFLRPGRAPGYARFAVRRVCRIYPPFAAAILGSALLGLLVQPEPIPQLSEWFNTVIWQRPISAEYIGRNLLMTGLTPDMTLDLVMWSLVHELRISLVFPLLFLLTRRWPVLSMAGSVLLGVVCTLALGGREADSVAMSLVDTGRFVFLFTAGILVARHLSALRDAVGRLRAPWAGGLWLFALALLMSPGPTVYRFYDFAWGAGAVLLLVLVVGSPRVGRVLSMRGPVWLGRVSYSLYLVHVPVLVGAVHLCGATLPLPLTVAAAVAVSLLAAEAMFRAVELPSMRLGRWLTRSGPRPVATGAAWPEGTRP